MWIEYIKKAVSYFKNHGFIPTVKRIWLELFIYRKAIMYNKQLVPSSLDFTDNLNIKIASEEDIDEEYHDVGHTKKEALEKLSKGHILFLTKDRGINIYYGWVELLNINIPWLGIKNLYIPSNIGYESGGYVLAKYRGQRLLMRNLKFTEKYLLNTTNVNRVFCVAAPDNVAANRSIILSGRIPYQHIKYFKIMGLRLYIVESLENKKRKIKKIFIHNSDFWNVFSSILSRS